MIIADLHNDTAYELYYNKQKLKKNNLHIDLTKQAFSKNLLFYSIYMNPIKYMKNPRKYFFNIYNNFINEIAKNKDEIKLFESVSDFTENSLHNAVLTVEGGDFVEKISDVALISALKIKMLGLTWNFSNRLASSVTDENDKGLSPFGYEIIKKMEEKNITVDLSHSSDKTFFDVIKIAKKPVAVSHSNSRTICKNNRNITDEMFVALIENKGILGLNFHREFVGEDAEICDFLKHIEHFLKLGGENAIAFGSDFDGTDTLTYEIHDFRSFYTVYDILENTFGKKTADKIAYKNIMNFLNS